MLTDNLAKYFIVLLGFLFFAVAIVVSLVSDYPNVIPAGIGIVALFLIILPFTHQKGQQ